MPRDVPLTGGDPIRRRREVRLDEAINGPTEVATWLTDPEHQRLGHIGLGVRSRVFTFQGYIEPDTAREIADMLYAIARDVTGDDGEPG